MDKTEKIVDFKGAPSDMGSDFESFEEEGELYWFTPGGRRYWYKNSVGDWVSTIETGFKRKLVSMGVMPMITKEETQEGKLLSEVDEKLLEIESEAQVKYAGPVAGYKRGMHVICGDRVLVTEELNLIEPEAGEWPILEEYLKNLLSSEGWVRSNKGELIFINEGDTIPRYSVPEDEGFDQRKFVFAWLAQWLEAAHLGKPSLGQAMVFAGDTNCGKTFFVDLIKELFGGKEAHPYQWLLGGQFNKELVGTSVLIIDDEVSKTDMKSRKDLGARLKQFVAVPSIRIEGKGADALHLKPLHRLIFMTNMDEDNLSVLPPPSVDLVDADGRSGKMMLVKCYKHGFPMPMGSKVEKRACFDAMVKELPAFVHYLLNDFVLEDEYCEDRYGVIPWMHPEILEALDELSPWSRMLYFIDRVIVDKENYPRLVMTSESVYKDLTNEDNNLTGFERKSFKINYLHLKEIAAKRPDRIVDLYGLSRGKRRVYAIFAEGVRKNDEEENRWMRDELKKILDGG